MRRIVITQHVKRTPDWILLLRYAISQRFPRFICDVEDYRVLDFVNVEFSNLKVKVRNAMQPVRSMYTLLYEENGRRLTIESNAGKPYLTIEVLDDGEQSI